ncbi:FMN-binding glutamate synthase family protein [Neoroseomonas soli]|uniref:FMN-binding glutamate synthase family protein n=1 Tax=Neoroseomonas soli TaxID=1081025 RepID=UPI001FE48918|nr:FMN-binding glutamate synthase family protein [Neoroseomonas soli]
MVCATEGRASAASKHSDSAGRPCRHAKTVWQRSQWPNSASSAMGIDCVSPAAHGTFSTPVGLMRFIAELRELSGGKPVGFKLCIGHRREFMSMVKAMLKTGIVPDFIVVDGAEGGTETAPIEFVNRVGMPMLEGLTFLHNTLRGAGLRDQVRIAVAGKIVSAFDIARAIALGADWCNAAPGFMFAIGCIQAQACHTNRCPVGIATLDPVRQRAIDIGGESDRVARFHRNAMKALAEIAGAAGLNHPSNFMPYHFMFRQKDNAFFDGNEVSAICRTDSSSRARRSLSWPTGTAAGTAPMRRALLRRRSRTGRFRSAKPPDLSHPNRS